MTPLLEKKDDFLNEIDFKIKESIETYMAYLIEYNQKVNLISRKITGSAFNQLIEETFLLEKHILENEIIDAGSGNGILGIPIAIKNPKKKINLVESKEKKAVFLEYIKKKMFLTNVSIHCSSIKEFVNQNKKKEISLIARGFPGLEIFCDFLNKGLIKEAIFITSQNKIKKINKNMVNMKKKAYNIPLRNNLKILKMENVSRET